MIIIFLMTAAYFVYVQPQHHEYAGYESAEVLGITSLQNKFLAQSVTVRIRLDSGEVLQVISGALGTVSVGGNVCLEKRRYKESLDPFYKVTKQEKCDSDL